MQITACKEYNLRVEADKYARRHIEALVNDAHEYVTACAIVDLNDIETLDICAEADAQINFFIREAYRNIAMSLLEKI